MSGSEKTKITVETLVNVPVQKAWEAFTSPEHITGWNFASDDWCAPRAVNNLTAGGKFNFRMESTDGSMGFDFEGTYDEVELNKRIRYSIIDGRTVEITFEQVGDQTSVTETFEAEGENPIEMQRGGWQAILNNYKKYTEAL